MTRGLASRRDFLFVIFYPKLILFDARLLRESFQHSQCDVVTRDIGTLTNARRKIECQ